ncbi:hypothetical protein OG883_41040 [Streptomyces sp. NBC_01142]|uniref:hypothetical protein n=1 Tax=Streptomyces sp. NBC_01142 TaxID=2975865 RepID=UPI00224D551E|nr:hypothetical protein [Streptomyces sp. NBC_01142]MCX4826060.1 hypothetical protein [Streptomyces sp. NBC_01142]
MGEDRRTVLYTLVIERGIRSHKSFSDEYARVAEQLRAEGQDVAPAPVARHYERLLVVGGLKSQPYSPTARVLERMFHWPVLDLLRPASEMPELERQHSTPRAATSPVLNESELLMTARDAAEHAGEAASLHLDEMTLDQLHDDLVELARKYGCTAPAEVCQRASSLLRTAQVLLERTRSPEQHARLYYAAGQATALLSAVSFDLGALAPAVSFARSSAQYGKTIEHGPLQAYAYGMLAFMAFWDGRPSEAVRLAKSAQQFGGLGDTACRRLYAIEARAYGHLRNADQAQRAIRDALEHSSGARDELHDDIGGEFGFDAARIAMSNATTSLLLRDAEGAEASATRALALLSSRPTAEQPIVVSGPAAIDLARSRLMRSEVEGAHEALAPVFRVPPDWRGAGMLERLTAARIELTRPELRSAPAALTLAEQIEDFSALSPARRLGATSPLAIEG